MTRPFALVLVLVTIASACGPRSDSASTPVVEAPRASLGTADIDAYRDCTADADCVVVGLSCNECAFASVNRDHVDAVRDLLGCSGGFDVQVQCVGANFQPICRNGRCE